MKPRLKFQHRDHSMHIERERESKMHCKGVECTRSLAMGSTSAEGQILVI
jgi:hypothetical protein